MNPIHVLRDYAPLIASASVLSTLIICVILSKIYDVYVGGLTWPYFSDMGRDPPAYYFFAIGLTIVTITVWCTWFFNFQFQNKITKEAIANGNMSKFVRILVYLVAFCGLLSPIGIFLLGWFSTASYPKIHNNGAYWFFYLSTISLVVNTIVSYKILSAVRHGSASNGIKVDDVKRTFHVQLVFSILFTIAFIIYMPVGLNIITPFQRLTIDECLDRDLGDNYCKETMRYNETYTKLWNYENDLTATQMRTLGQLGCILTLVGYSLSFRTHKYDNDSKDQVPEYVAE